MKLNKILSNKREVNKFFSHNSFGGRGRTVFHVAAGFFEVEIFQGILN
jgi:hypothetical protein